MRQHGHMVMRTARGLVGDLILTGLLLLVGLGTLPFVAGWATGSRPVDPLAIVLVTVAAGSAALRRWPLLFFGVATVATSVYLLLGYPYGPFMLSVAVAAYTLARHLRLRLAVIAAVLGLVVLLAHLVTNDSALNGLFGLLPGSAWIVVPFTIGLARRLTVEAAARGREASERRALDDERLRLASEVHDIVGHGLAAIQMQADIARHVGERKPEQAALALDAISRASAEALAELRTTLAAIAADDTGTRRESRAPTPGLHRIDDLCERMREAGIEVELTVRGEPATLVPAVDVAAYRVLQESLTNVAKHASSRRATVTVTYSSAAVEIEVVNARTIPGPIDQGFGITGMDRRTHDTGGTLSVTAEHGEFRVAATFPVAAPR